jgi:GNAT superfamily N-acetyltransferase
VIKSWIISCSRPAIRSNTCAQLSWPSLRASSPRFALVFDGGEAVAWCQYGTPEELPNIHHRKEYEAALDKPPDYRITCIFVDRKYRRKGVTAAALRGAVDLIAEVGGGVVEGYPHDTGGQKVSVLYNGTRSLYERAGFGYLRPQRQEELRDAQGCAVRPTPAGCGPRTTSQPAARPRAAPLGPRRSPGKLLVPRLRQCSGMTPDGS